MCAATGVVLGVNPALMNTHNLGGDRQTQTCTTAWPLVKLVEHAWHNMRWNAGAVVTNMQFKVVIL
jgi:hypothetical protein